MQNWYSSDYDGLPIKLKAELAKQASLFKPFLFNTGRPLLSTADVPYHALKYAYGTKFYKGHQHERLRPRWRKDGRAERPYSGKVYVSLHPLDDYTEYNPSHITSWFRQGLAKLSNLISSERETSFLGFMRKKRIVIQHKAKYPSFKGAYKERYEVKYGIDKSMYEKLQKGFNDFPPHSDERKSLTLLLGEYLCAYHEVRLIDEAREEAEKNGKILIYRDEDGKFSLKHPATPHTAVKRLHKLVMFERGIFESLSANKSQRTVALTPEQIKAKLMTALPGKGNKEKRESIQLRLFGVKKFFEDGEAVIPVVTLTK